MTTTTPAVDFPRLLQDLGAATHALRAAADVPVSVARLVDRLDIELHAGRPLDLRIDPYLSALMYASALRAMKAVRHDSVDQRRRDLRIALEQLRHAVRDIVESVAVDDDRPVKELLGQIVATLSAPQPAVAYLLGISARQLQRWLSPLGPAPEGADAARVRVVAQLVNQLRHTFTGPGVLRWFTRPHPQLDRPPIELLDDPLQAPRLRDLALSARTQLA